MNTTKADVWESVRGSGRALTVIPQTNMNEKITIEIENGKTKVTIFGEVDIVHKETNGEVKEVPQQTRIPITELSGLQYLFLQKRGFTDMTMPRSSQDAFLLIKRIKEKEAEIAEIKAHENEESLFDVTLSEEKPLVKRGRGRPRKVA